ncbi:MAG: hypothetical protein E7562_05335 [Ruminococcaceae bacterium]|nr:hypothetical protein [Oscillospiraceae bacterium]
MYQCRDCGSHFEVAIIKNIKGKGKIRVCPECFGVWFTTIQHTHCRCCGAKLPVTAVEYCNEHCERRGLLMWQRERDRRKKVAKSSLYTTQSLLERYNKRYHTRYSYGQFVTLILPTLTKEQIENEL